jgi:hypothetical protein
MCFVEKWQCISHFIPLKYVKAFRNIKYKKNGFSTDLKNLPGWKFWIEKEDISGERRTYGSPS